MVPAIAIRGKWAIGHPRSRDFRIFYAKIRARRLPERGTIGPRIAQYAVPIR
jgi:hypothetical protein